MLLFNGKVVSDTFVTPWTVAYQTPLFMGFSKQEYWSGLPFLSPGASHKSHQMPNKHFKVAMKSYKRAYYADFRAQ